MIVLNNETLKLFKEYVAGILAVPLEKVVYDLRSVYAGRTSDIGVLAVGDNKVLSPNGNDCLAVFDTAKQSYVFGNNYGEYYYFLGSVGKDFDVIVDDTYKCSFPVGSVARGFFFHNLQLSSGDYPVKFYALRFRSIV
jgi:hypothetical protein